MPATLLNAPARPLLTALAVVALAMAILFAAALPFGLRASREHADAGQTRFARRMLMLPAIVVTPPDSTKALATADR